MPVVPDGLPWLHLSEIGMAKSKQFVSKLKPCPFCGERDLSDRVTRIDCNVCFITGPIGHSRMVAVRLWNTRPNEIVLKAK